MDVQDRSFMLLSMEEKLADDGNGAYRDDLKAKLFECLGNVKRRLDSGLSPDEFSSNSRFKEAVEAGMAVIDKVWAGLHR